MNLSEYPPENSRFAYLMWMLHDVAAEAPTGHAEVGKALRGAADKLVALAATGGLRGQTRENYVEAFNKRLIGMNREAFYGLVAKALSGSGEPLRAAIRQAPVFGSPANPQRVAQLDAAIEALEAARPTFLMIFNPDNANHDYSFGLDDWGRIVHAVQQDGSWTEAWSTGMRRAMLIGSRLLFLRQGGGAAGLVGLGRSVSEIQQRDDGKHRIEARIEVAMVDAPDGLRREALQRQFPEQNWSPQGNGARIPNHVADLLERMLLDAGGGVSDGDAGVGTGDRQERFMIRGDCQVWIEPWNGTTSLVINSVGGKADRRPGMAVLLAELARQDLTATEAGYHPTGRKFQALDGVPWTREATLLDPRSAAQALQRAAGRVEGGNQGSRLRLLFPRVSESRLVRVLRQVAAEPEARKAVRGVHVVDHVLKFLASEGLSFSREQVADFYLSVRTKPFVLLAGLSGTGKSVLARRFAEACGFPAHLIAVRPDWSDPTELLGYVNLDGTFVPGQLIPHLVAAFRNSTQPYFLILDEMNLARVEHYFADILSVMETRRRVGEQRITDPINLGISESTPLQGPDLLVQGIREFLDDGGIRIPPNLCLVGTVNMDESTHPFSKKVLDRAMTLEFAAVDLHALPARTERPEDLSLRMADLDAPYLSLAEIHEGNEDLCRRAINLLVELNEVLADQSMQVGFRTRDEVCLYLVRDHIEGLLGETTALDLAVHHKVLPRVQGGDEVAGILSELHRILQGHGMERSVRKVDEMRRRLAAAGYTSFWS